MRKFIFVCLLAICMPAFMSAQKSSVLDRFLIEFSANPLTLSTDNAKMREPFFSTNVGYYINHKLSVQLGFDYQFFYNSNTSNAKIVYPMSFGAAYTIYDNSEDDWKIELAARGGLTSGNDKYDYSFYDISGKCIYKIGFIDLGVRHSFFSEKGKKNAMTFYIGYGVRF